MSRRSTQARQMAAALSSAAGVDVDLQFDVGQLWYVAWGNGPTVEAMHALVDQALTSGRYPDMADRQLRYSRGTTARAWAARAIAAQRDGTLDAEIDAGVTFRRTMPPRRPFGGSEPLTDEDLPALAYVERLLEETAHPQRPDRPEDSPLIDELLLAGDNNEYRMVRILTGNLQPPAPAGRPTLRVLPGGRSGDGDGR